MDKNGVIAAPFTANACKIKTGLIELETREKVTQKFIILTPENPVASLIVFGGLFGDIEAGGWKNNPWIKNVKSFVVRARKEFAEQGLIVAVIDAPSDYKHAGSSGHKKAPGMGLDWRLTDEHMQDADAVIGYLQHKNLPIFLAGQSLGTLSDAISVHGVY